VFLYDKNKVQIGPQLFCPHHAIFTFFSVFGTLIEVAVCFYEFTMSAAYDRDTYAASRRHAHVHGTLLNEERSRKFVV
jgi:hypothetical protein